MLRHCRIPGFAAASPRRKMPKAAAEKEKPSSPGPGSDPQPGYPAASGLEAPPPQKVLRIFSINIITQGLPFCRRRGANVSWSIFATLGPGLRSIPAGTAVFSRLVPPAENVHSSRGNARWTPRALSPSPADHRHPNN
ncbi:hypothetical protein AAFF_G00412510 [Aldrovandia affinis]|uniref:Uncharacterized protein n=1 Tax=Aldrovandia affinis TaxID=143900 RepID=A0AAD7SBD3_9TELE|nr:hypothetical protein AAFF_G00412510 [Aldrovandia affinis]